MRKETNLYEKDFNMWLEAQVKSLRQSDFEHLDIEHLIEEIDSLSKRDRRALKKHLINLLTHMLKWEYQSTFRGNSWLLSILNSRDEIALILEDSPSLNNECHIYMIEAYKKARERAHNETGINIKTFPVKCPWTYQEIMTIEF